MSDQAITRRNGGPFARMNWDSPASVNELSANRGVTKPKSGHIVMFGCGCSSWISYPDGYPKDVQKVAERLAEDNPERWDGAWVARWVKDGNRRLFEDGTPMREWLSCPHGEAA